jgi:hypothetical protein
LWGFYSIAERQLANHIFDLIIDKNRSQKFNPNNNSPKGADQLFLSQYVYPLIRNNVLAHDSFFCGNLEQSSPFPSKRTGDCFVGNPAECYPINGTFFACPLKCRPKNQAHWKYC